MGSILIGIQHISSNREGNRFLKLSKSNKYSKYLDKISYKINKPILYMHAYMIRFLSSSRCLHQRFCVCALNDNEGYG